MSKNRLGAEPLLDAMAVYKTELAKGSPATQLEQLRKIVEGLPDINRQDKAGMTYLAVAVRQFKADVVELLLEHGADPNICDHSGVYPLAYAFLKKTTDTGKIIELLLKFGADPSLGKTAKHTPFYYAHITRADREWVELLQEANIQLHGSPYTDTGILE